MVNELSDQNLNDEALFEQAMQEGELEQLIDNYSNLAPPHEGEILEGRILAFTESEAIVDFGFKSEGSVPLEQLRDAEGRLQVQPGDVIPVMMERAGAMPQDGYVPLSYRRAADRKAWDNLEAAHRDNLLISCRVLSRTKGGFLVDVGIEGFMPSSQMELPPGAAPDSLIGQDLPVKILKINRRRGNVVVSRKSAVEEETSARRAALLEVLEEGAVLSGVVKNLTDYGAFVDLGGIDGLLHVSDITYGRLTHPSEALKSGQEVTVKVLKFDRERERLSLGIKQLAPDPWSTVHERYPIGGRVIGRVVSITDYGAFVELEAGVEGLIHITEMTWSRRLKHPKKLVQPGDSVECVVLAVSEKDRRISLGIKQLEPDPWTTVDQRYAIGSVVEGRVRKLTDFGAFIEIEEGIDGLIHVSDLSWTRRIKTPSEVLRKGQVVQAVILNIDAKGRRLSLGVKQLTPHPWEAYLHTHQVGDVVRGKVIRAANFGVFVEVADGVEALCHNSEIPSYTGKSDQPPLTIGEEYEFKIIKINDAERKIGLSIEAISEDEERSRLEEYQRKASAATMTLEEVVHLKDHGSE